MSGKLAMHVLESRVPSNLKFAAATMALHANEDGYRIWPSVQRVAWLMGLSTRQVQIKLEALRRLGVLIPLTSLKGGRGKSTRYQLQIPFELERPSWQEELRSSLHGLRNNEAGNAVLSETTKPAVETTKPAVETTKPDVRNHEASFTRSFQDQSEDLPEEQAPLARLSFLELLKNSNPQLAAELERRKLATRQLA